MCKGICIPLLQGKAAFGSKRNDYRNMEYLVDRFLVHYNQLCLALEKNSGHFITQWTQFEEKQSALAHQIGTGMTEDNFLKTVLSSRRGSVLFVFYICN